MKNIQLIIIFIIMFSYPAFGQIDSYQVDNPVFVFNNAFNKRDISYNRIAKLLDELGYDGIEHREIEDLFELKQELEKYGLKIYADYARFDLEKDPPYVPEWKDVFPRIAGTDLILWVYIRSDKYKSSDLTADEEVVNKLRKLADMAKPYGIRVAIYHHYKYVAEKPLDSYRLAKLADRDNVGAVFNLCHFLRTGNEKDLPEIMEKIAPALYAVSISGADKGNTREMGWNRLIQPLGEGSFDVYKVVSLLWDNGYKGPVGFQCYTIEGEPEDFLKKSIGTWEHYKSLYEQGINKLTEKEKAGGWELLFDGYSTNGWRGIHKESFPETGWEIKNGEIRVTASGGAESAHGGDVITTEQYGDFELKWQWKLLTKGGNSGLKYFVKESDGEKENEKYGFGLEYQILDDDNHPWMLEGKMKPNDEHTVGAAYGLFAPSANKKPKPLGEWNQSRIVAKGNKVEHWLNGEKILEYERGSKLFMENLQKSKFKGFQEYGQAEKGHVLLQDHGNKVRFRNIKIRKM